ncbi:MAG: LptF/LptG family permease [Rickettsiales bacterium]|nr:MAG: LptF/LptG family permease [Rickettsiales bacterium]
MLKPYKFSLYLTKDILKNFLYIFFGMIFIIFIIDFFEQGKDLNSMDKFYSILKMTLFRIPNFIEITLNFILLIGALFTFYKFSNSSQIVIIRSSGMSIFQIIKFPVFVAFIMGVLVIFCYNPWATKLRNKADVVENKLKNKIINEDYISFKNGLWFIETKKDAKITFRVGGFFQNNFVFKNVVLVWISNDNKFVKRIDADTLFIDDDHFVLTDAIIKEEGQKERFMENFFIKTRITQSFLDNLTKNAYDDPDLIPFLKLQDVINSLEISGFSARKFQIKYYFFLTQPFLFALMILISAYFGIVHNRENKKILSVVYGLSLGFVIFLLNNIIVALASSEKLTIFDSSLFLVLIYIIIASMLLLKKDNLSNL